MALLRIVLSASFPAGVAVALLVACVAVGFALLPKRLRPPQSAVTLLTSLSLGATFIGWISWVVGAVLGTHAILPIIILLCLAAAPRSRVLWTTSRAAVRHVLLLLRASPVTSLALGGILLLLVPQLLLPLVDSDGLRYHLALPKLFLLTGRVFTYPYDVTGAFPQTAEMLYFLALRLGSGEAAKFLHAAFFSGTLVALAVLLHQDRRTRTAAVLAPVLFAASPVALAPAAAAFTDHIALFHVAVALLLVARRANPLLLGCALGGALTTKLTTVPVAIVLWVAAGLRATRGQRRSTLWRAAVPALIALAPFAVRNVAEFGDPLHPIGRALVGLPIPGVSHEMVHFTSFYHRDVAPPLGIAWGPGLASAPADEFAGWHHLIGLFAVAVALPYPPARLALLPFLAYVPVGFLFRPPTRYLLPLLWSLAAVEALALVWLFRRRAALLGLLLALSSALLAGRVLTSTFSPFGFLLGRLDRQTYLERNVPGYATARFVNTLPRGGRVMALDFPAPYYFNRPWIVEGILNQPPLKTAIATARSVEQVLAWLRALDIRYLVVTPAYGGGQAVSLLPLAASPRALSVAAALRARLELLRSSDGIDVYHVPAR
jgi:hypothetical protein